MFAYLQSLILFDKCMQWISCWYMFFVCVCVCVLFVLVNCCGAASFAYWTFVCKGHSGSWWTRHTENSHIWLRRFPGLFEAQLNAERTNGEWNKIEVMYSKSIKLKNLCVRLSVSKPCPQHPCIPNWLDSILTAITCCNWKSYLDCPWLCITPLLTIRIVERTASENTESERGLPGNRQRTVLLRGVDRA